MFSLHHMTPLTADIYMEGSLNRRAPGHNFAKAELTNHTGYNHE